VDTSSAAPAPAPAAFSAAIDQLRRAELRPELTVREIPAPGRIAPFSFAIAADVGTPTHGRDSDLGTGRFILMHDPEEPEAWGGDFRIVSFTQASQDPEIGVDPFLAEVTWTYLLEALEQRGAEHHSESGTATKILSSGFGELAAQGDGAQIELRASWTPTGHDFGAHLTAWTDLLCAIAGLPVQPGAAGLDAHRRNRG
jgi:hypothetical protein